MENFKIDFFELCFLAETCIPPVPIARSCFWNKLIDKYYFELSENQKETMLSFITRNNRFNIQDKDCEVFYNRFNPKNQYQVKTNFNDKIETIDCFLHDGKYHTEINKHILDEYIIEKKNKIYGKQTL